MTTVSTPTPPSRGQVTGEAPSHFGALGLGGTNPHVPDRMMPEDDHPERGRREEGAHRVQPNAGTAGEYAIRRARIKKPSTITISSANTTQRQLGLW
jgi:hypothetical protein